MYDQPIYAEQTFVWNDKLVITETDELSAQLSNAGNVDVWISYIDQEFAAQEINMSGLIGNPNAKSGINQDFTFYKGAIFS